MSESAKSPASHTKIDFESNWLHGASDIPGNMPDTSPTDLGNAKRLVIASGDDVRFCHTTKKWLIWNGKRWVQDKSGEIFRLAKGSVRAILTEAAFANDDKERAALVRHEQKSEAQPRIKAMVTLAESESGIPVQLEDLDRDGMLFNVLNGTIDLRTGGLHEHRREDLITKIAPVEFNPEATCPAWEKFLREIFSNDPCMTLFVQRAIGYSITANVSEHVLFLLYGVGANGKTTFLEVLRYVSGDYSQAADFGSFLISKGQTIRNDLAKLHGARFVTATESEAGKRMAESVVKQFTGGDTVTARFLYGEHFEFRAQFKLWLATNHKPKIIGTDEAIWRRIRLVPFTITIPKEKRDRELTEKLKLEASGILNWALAGLRNWQTLGLDEPDSVTLATNEYRENQDALAHFLDAKCTVAPDAEEKASELYRSYKDWTEANGEFRLTQRDFATALAERGFVKKRGNAGFVWRGVEVNSV